MQCPKPPKEKKKKAKNNPVPTEPKKCAFCRRVQMCETHEVFGGKNRQISIANKYQVPLCNDCHGLITANHEDTLDEQQIWRENFQRNQEVEWWHEGDISMAQARERWIKLIGRSYL